MPATLSVLAHVFPPEERPRAIAIWAGFAGVGAALGGVSSGWLLQHFWWGSIFLTNVGVVVIALVAGYFLVPSSRHEGHATLDPVGALLSIVGLGTLIYAIIEAPDHGWLSAPTLVTFAVAAVVIAMFVGWELRSTDPMLDLRFFRNPVFTAATSTITLIFFVAFGTFFIVTQYFQSVLGYTPLGAGVRVLPWAAAYMVSTTRSAGLVERFGQRRVVSSGLVIVAAGLALLSRCGANTGYGLVATALVVMALGMGVTTAPSTGAIMRSLPLRKAGVGSAVNDTTRELGGALGVAVFGSVLASHYRTAISDSVGSLPHVAGRSLGATLQAATTLGGEQGQGLADAARHAYAHAFDATLTLTVVVALFAAGLVSWLLRPAAAEVSLEEPTVDLVEA
jgi:EmrB/QacA subfamily drug resistance transporter